GLIQSRVIKDKDAIAQLHLGFGFLPHGFGIRFEAVQQASEGVVCRWIILLGLHTGSLGSSARFGSRNEKVDIVVFIAFRRIHGSFFTTNPLNCVTPNDIRVMAIFKNFNYEALGLRIRGIKKIAAGGEYPF